MDLIFYSPMSGPVVPLEEVSDPVFAQRMAGDGLAIDPLDRRVLSPCNGKVTQVHRNSIRIVARGADAKEAVEALGSAARAAFGRVEEKPSAAPAGKIAIPTPASPGQEEPGVLRGVSASPGLAIGRVAKLVRPVVQVEEYAADSALERQQLHEAVAATRSDIETESVEAGESQGEILLATESFWKTRCWSVLVKSVATLPWTEVCTGLNSIEKLWKELERFFSQHLLFIFVCFCAKPLLGFR